MKQTRMSWKMERRVKIDWPMRADAFAWPPPPKPPPAIPRAFGATTT